MTRSSELVAWSAALLLAACARPAEPAAPAPAARSLVLVVVDTLRRDRLGAYGDARGLTPRLDALAAESLVFTDATAPSSWTKPSVASLFTGLYPARHGALGSRDQRPALQALRPELWSFAEELQRTGLRTAAFVNNPHLDATWGFGRGFDEFVQPAGGAHDLLAAAARWVEASREPYFVYVHLIEPHAPYEPPPDLLARFATAAPGVASPFTSLGDPIEVVLWSRAYARWQRRADGAPFDFDEARLRPDLLKDEQLAALRALDSSITRETLLAHLDLDQRGFDDPELVRRREHLASRYDAEVAWVDREVGAFVQRLGAGGHLRDAALVVTADHGEAFLEHGLWGHQGDLHAEQVDVPLLLHVRVDGAPLRGEVHGALSLVDLAPTLAELLGRRAPQGLDGRSLWPALAAGARALPERAVFADLLVQDRAHAALRRGDLKLVLTLDDRTRELRAYDVARDPRELAPLDVDDPALAPLRAELEAHLAERARQLATLATADGAPAAPAHDKALGRQLDALGY
ncbi:MAG: sulfatase [Planctomycetes bacterium]|nr:sulfatase [Planctomycetota bacterium]